MLDDRALEGLGCGRTATEVDVRAVRRVEQRQHVRARAGEDRGRDPIGGAVGAIEHDLQSVEVWRKADEEVLVALHEAAHVANEPDPALGRPRELRVVLHGCLDAVFRRIRKLQAGVIEELDPVVGRRIV